MEMLFSINLIKSKQQVWSFGLDYSSCFGLRQVWRCCPQFGEMSANGSNTTSREKEQHWISDRSVAYFSDGT
ncbi:hypothetical protein F8S20_11145 [Nostoc sp. BAE]|nr:hypothetical protein [Nostoc commune BAE]